MNFGILPVQLFVPVKVSVRARGGVAEGHPPEQHRLCRTRKNGNPPRRHELARLVTEVDVRDFDTAEHASGTYSTLEGLSWKHSVPLR
jgi:hypothetical protein